MDDVDEGRRSTYFVYRVCGSVSRLGLEVCDPSPDPLSRLAAAPWRYIQGKGGPLKPVDIWLRFGGFWGSTSQIIPR